MQLPSLQTIAEQSNFTATSKYDDVSAFLKSLAASSPLVSVSTIGKTGEGREIPLVILADPPVTTPEQVAKSGKLLVLCVGNIHAGEVDGKEALLAILRDIAADPPAYRPLLQNLILAVVPNYNADGNEKISKDSRPGQVGPEQGQGTRENAAGLDLNRDYIKLEAPETRALVKFIRTWDPALVIDTHTTNGSLHRYVLTYGGPKNPAGDASIIEYVNNTLLPGVGRRIKEKHGIDTFFYGNFAQDHKKWEDYPDDPRFGAPYIGLRNRLPILTESYSYATYEERVRAQEAFVLECLHWAAEHKKQIAALIADADKRTEEVGRLPRETDTVAIRSSQQTFDKKVTLLGYVEDPGHEGTVQSRVPHDYQVDHAAKFVPEASVPRAYAYVLPATAQGVVEALLRHGVQVEALQEPKQVEVTIYRIEQASQSEAPFQEHHLRRMEVSARKESRKLEAGAFVVRTGQKLGVLASYLLEPASTDGLATWNFFDADLEVGHDFPVLRVEDPTPMNTRPVPPLEP